MTNHPDPLRRAALMSLLCGAAVGPRAFAQGAPWPTKAVRIVVPAGPGTAPDTLARLFAEHLARRLQQPFIVDPQPGAAGTIGSATVARAEPDGYTLMYGYNQLVTINPHLYEKLPYDAAAGFAPVALVAKGAYTLLGSPTLDANDLPGLIALARRRPGELVYASSGSGSIAHVGMELMKQATGIDLLHVPYKTGSASTTDLISGRVHVRLEPTASAVPLVRAGKVKALAVTAAKRAPVLPEVATVAETLPDFEITGWHGVLAPLRTPAEVVQRLHQELRAATELPEVRQRLASLGVEAATASPAEMAEMIRRESAQWARVIRQAGIKAD
jgi:tripartite-type tricarboxylate transporter receptor subunit TctC